jgi:arylsulfatase A-like enzyme
MMRTACLVTLSIIIAAPAVCQTRQRNVVMFVADGLRPGMVTPENAPVMSALLRRGVRFSNSHSLFPTFTTANASGLATGHLLGDTGDFSNVIAAGFPVASAAGSPTPFLENDAVLGEMDAHFEGDYLHGTTVLAAAREAGLSTAAIGKLGPALIMDHTERTGQKTVLVDDSTGRAGGIPLQDEVRQRLEAANLPVQAPTRGPNGAAGDAATPGTLSANTAQQDWLVAVATQAVLPMFKARARPFAVVFWSRDPDGTQHNQGDSLGRLVPGINGKTSLAAIRNADNDLGKLLEALKALDLEADTDVILTSDHGFSTIFKESATSFAAGQSYKDVPAGELPPGFVAIDLAHALGLKLSDPDAGGAALAEGSHPLRANGLLGDDPAHPEVVVAANGGSDLIYLPGADRSLAARVAGALAGEDYVSGLFVDDALGPVAGALPLSAIGLHGTAVTPSPSIVVNFRSFSLGCADPTTCGAEVADTGLQQGQGMHGSFSRADTRNVMGAAGPDFRSGFDDAAPASNADLGRTMAKLLGLDLPAGGALSGRVLTEATPDGAMPRVEASMQRSEPGADGRSTELRLQTAAGVRYYDAAGYPGATVGLPAEAVR